MTNVVSADYKMFGMSGFPYQGNKPSISDVSAMILNYCQSVFSGPSKQFTLQCTHTISYPQDFVNYNGDVKVDRKLLNISKLKEIQQLDENWNGYGALPVPESVIQSVNSFLDNCSVQPNIFPTAQQSIQCEYNRIDGSYLEIEIFVDHVSIFIEQSDGFESEEEFPSSNLFEIGRKYNDFINNKA
ncbi:MAG: hypothetical protein VB071_11260 [Lawsonibacter sp.]|nr:hypothetical protein [Lawsonibacter sp.]